jgi:hypothetical protein
MQENMQKTLQITLEHGKTQTTCKMYEKHVKTAQNAKITTKLLQKFFAGFVFRFPAMCFSDSPM